MVRRCIASTGKAASGEHFSDASCGSKRQGLPTLVDEGWQLVLSSLEPTSVCALQVTASSVRGNVDSAGMLLCAQRLRLPCPLAGLAPSEAFSTYWRARPGAPIGELTRVVHLAAERGLVQYLLNIPLRSSSAASASTDLWRGGSSEEEDDDHGARTKGGSASPLLELTDANGLTPLHIAASAGQAATCRALCQLASQRLPPEFAPTGAFVAVARQTNRRRTVLHYAATFGDIDTLDALLESVSQTEAQDLLVMPDRRNRSAASVAYHEGHRRAAHHLVQAHDTLCSPPAHRSAGVELLVLACERGDIGMAAALLAKRADINGSRLADDLTPLMAVALRGASCLEVLDVLLQHPDLAVSLHEKRTGRTALHFACQHGHAAVVELLLMHGAVCTAEASGARSPLYLAAECGSIECVEALLPFVPVECLSRTTSRFSTPILVAERRGHWAVAKRLASFAESSGASTSCSGQPFPVVFSASARSVSSDLGERPRSAGAGKTLMRVTSGSRGNLHTSSVPLLPPATPRCDTANATPRRNAAAARGAGTPRGPKTPPRQGIGDMAIPRRRLRLGPCAARRQGSREPPGSLTIGFVPGCTGQSNQAESPNTGSIVSCRSARGRAAPAEPNPMSRQSSSTPRREPYKGTPRQRSSTPRQQPQLDLVGPVSITAWELASRGEGAVVGPMKRSASRDTNRSSSPQRSTWEQRAAMHRLSTGGRVADLRKSLTPSPIPGASPRAASDVALPNRHGGITPRPPLLPSPSGGIVVFGALGGA